MCKCVDTALIKVLLDDSWNPQRCNSMIAKWSIQLYFYVGLFYIGSSCSGKHSIRKLPKVNNFYGLLLLEFITYHFLGAQSLAEIV